MNKPAEAYRVETGPNGLPKLVVHSEIAAGEIFLQGAHVTAWQPAGHQPVLWMSGNSWFEQSRPIRGGVPICFPWFGPHRSDNSLPAHGTARICQWNVVDVQRCDDGAVEVLLETTIAAFHLSYRVLFGADLIITLTTTLLPTAEKPEQFEDALHTYFSVSDIRHIAISGLETSRYLNKVPQVEMCEPSGATLRFIEETDRVYMDTQETVVLQDPGFARKLTVAKTGSRSTVIWNPWIDKSRRMPDFGDDEWTGMVCIETANVGANAVTLQPGQSHSTQALISVSHISG
jgi:glucose-6-phosphate 1-epimerase